MLSSQASGGLLKRRRSATPRSSLLGVRSVPRRSSGDDRVSAPRRAAYGRTMASVGRGRCLNCDKLVTAGRDCPSRGLFASARTPLAGSVTEEPELLTTRSRRSCAGRRPAITSCARARGPSRFTVRDSYRPRWSCGSLRRIGTSVFQLTPGLRRRSAAEQASNVRIRAALDRPRFCGHVMVR